MLRNPRVLSRAGRCVCLRPEVLELRMLPSGSSFALQSKGSAQKEVVSLQVPSTYVSQSATAIDVTITRSMGLKQVPIKSPLTLSLRAVSLSPASKRGGKPHESSQIAPLDESVTFQGGETTQTVELPINVEAPLPALVPVQITVSPKSQPQNQAVIVVDLASGQQVVPPSITNVSIVRSGSVGKGIAVTFSQPMAPASVENIHNYVVKSVPLNHVNLVALSSPTSVLQPTSYTTYAPQPVALKAARYNPATDTVLLVPKTPLTVAKSLIVRSPASLGSLRHGPKIAEPLTDANGNVLNPLNFPEGSFSITLGPKSPKG
jgi:hypothetical protein